MSYKISEYLGIRRAKGRDVIQCIKCQYVFCTVDKHWKDHALRLDSPVSKAGYRRSASGRFEMREYICPGCATVVDVEVALPGDEPLYDEIDVNTLPKKQPAIR